MKRADQIIIDMLCVRQWDGVVCLDSVVQKYVRQVYREKVWKPSRVIPFGPQIGSIPQYESRSTHSNRP